MKRFEHDVQCQVETDERRIGFPAFAESHIRIYFELDKTGRLRDIRVDKSLLRL
jgi:hypothetical protein